MTTNRVTVDVLLDPDESASALAEAAWKGLRAQPKDLPPKLFYDERGSELFEQITRLPEYYPTRREREILQARADEIAALAGAETLVELGSGAAVKTRILIDALQRARAGSRYVPFDVFDGVVRESARAVTERWKGITVHGVVGDFEHHLDSIPRSGTQLIAFLGGTIGNLLPAERARFLSAVRSIMRPGDHLLLGADLVKDPARLVAAYDDANGITAEFNRNVLLVLDARLGCTFDPADFDHLAVWDARNEWIEMRLRSRPEQTVPVPAFDGKVHFDAGEEMRTEVSAKFRIDGIRRELADAGLAVRETWTDPAGDFSLTLAGA